MLKKVRIKIETTKTELAGSFFLGKGPRASRTSPEAQKSEQITAGRYHDDGTRISVAYRESELTGLEGSEAILAFFKNEPQVVTLQRTGSVKTLLRFEAGQQHSCVYQTAIMPFDVCLSCNGVQNLLEQEGILTLDYVVEVKGGTPERVRMKVTLLPDFDRPQGE
jgi:uncharacterized beta-barrel protein YwiB (DUF1934 family)